ncbi:MAG TPA: hypothetical protein VJK47_00095 [Dehalococcoidales bacterium]|nr:hypothetical protein [Dehalococcoidales bacterium]
MMTAEQLYIYSKGQLKALGLHLRSQTAGGAYDAYFNGKPILSVTEAEKSISISLKKPDGSWTGAQPIANQPALRKFVQDYVKPMVEED